MACAVLAFSVWQMSTSPTPVEPYQSVASYQADRQVAETALDDGSRLWVDARSRTQVRYDERHRRVALQTGGVFAQVQSNAERPFTVEAGPVSVTAVGTAYEVQHRQGEHRVAVAEGRVRVEDLAGEAFFLSAGQIARRNPVSGWTVSEMPLAQIASWHTGRLVVSREPLADLARRLNQYRQAPILVEGEVAAATVSGVFSIQSEDADRMVQALADTVDACLALQPSGAIMITQDQSLCS